MYLNNPVSPSIHPRNLTFLIFHLHARTWNDNFDNLKHWNKKNAEIMASIKQYTNEQWGTQS